MKRYILIAMLLLACLCSLQAQTSIFDKFANHKEVTSIYISKQMFSLISDLNVENSMLETFNVQGISKKLSAMHILTCESPETIALLQKETSYFNSSNGYEILMQVNEEDEQVNFFIKEGTEENEYILIINNDDEFTLIRMVGKLTLKEIKQTVDL